MENKETQNSQQKSSPKPEAPQRLLDSIKENTLIARKLYFVYLLISAYCFLVALSTTDYQMVTNQASKLPISSFDIFISPITLFVLAFPISVSIFIYFQLYLHKLYQLITRLHDNYHSKELMFITPWIISFAKYPDKGGMGKLQNMVVTISLWYLLPLLLTFISIRFIKTHISVLNYIMGLTPFFTALIVVWFRNSYDSTKLFTNFFGNIKRYLFILSFLIFSTLITLIIIPKANNGNRIKFLNRVMFYDLSYQNFVDIKTADTLNPYRMNWGGINLAGANLKSSILVRSYLANASLKRANVSFTNFEQSSFENADLKRIDGNSANMRECVFRGARLDGSNLTKTNLERSDFRSALLTEIDGFSANMSESNFSNARFDRSKLFKANLFKAKLVHANIEKSDFREVDLTKIDGFGAIMKECNFSNAKFNEAILTEANLANSNFQGAEIKNANLYGAILSFANLQNANLMNSDFYKAKLNGADFKGTTITSAVFGYSDLSGAKNLTKDQLCKTITLFGTKLDSGLMEQVKECCPERLDDPAKETEKTE